MHKLHVLHELLAGHAQLLADGTAAGVGPADEGLVLQAKTARQGSSREAGLENEEKKKEEEEGTVEKAVEGKFRRGLTRRRDFKD